MKNTTTTSTAPRHSPSQHVAHLGHMLFSPIAIIDDFISQGFLFRDEHTANHFQFEVATRIGQNYYFTVIPYQGHYRVSVADEHISRITRLLDPQSAASALANVGYLQRTPHTYVMAASPSIDITRLSRTPAIEKHY